MSWLPFYIEKLLLRLDFFSVIELNEIQEIVSEFNRKNIIFFSIALWECVKSIVLMLSINPFFVL